MREVRPILWVLGLLCIASCAGENHVEKDLVNDQFSAAQAELREVVNSIVHDVETANVEGLHSIHLDSEKFTKFGPRSFDRQDVGSTNESEAAFWSSASNTHYEVEELKIDVFGDVAVVTYYPHVSFVMDGEQREVDGRQTLVLLKTADGWKIVHEHGTTRSDM